jgi:DNA-binding IclR family transcriptional regulator
MSFHCLKCPLMPRTSKAVIAASDGSCRVEGETGVLAVERALRVLGTFGGPGVFLSLAELSTRAQLAKSTALRLARTLSQFGYLVQGDEGTWRLGPSAGWLGARYQEAFDVNDSITPLLRDLARQCGESASLFVREGVSRTCLLRVESSAEDRPAVRPGTLFPLEKGAPGRVILAFSGEAGELYEDIRRRGYHIAIDERGTQAASVAAPVFGSNWRLLGAVSVSGSASRLSTAMLEERAEAVIRTARRASSLLGGTFVRSLG